MKKKLKAILAALSESAKGDDGKKLAEATKELSALVKESEQEASADDEAAGIVAKRDGESDEEHKDRLHKLAKHVAKHLGDGEEADDMAEDAADGDPEPDGDEKDGQDAQESKRDAIAGLIKESGLPKDFYTKDMLTSLAKKSYREAKAEIMKDARLAKSIRESVGEPVASLHRGLRESGNETDAAFLEAARGE